MTFFNLVRNISAIIGLICILFFFAATKEDTEKWTWLELENIPNMNKRASVIIESGSYSSKSIDATKPIHIYLKDNKYGWTSEVWRGSFILNPKIVWTSINTFTIIYDKGRISSFYPSIPFDGIEYKVSLKYR